MGIIDFFTRCLCKCSITSIHQCRKTSTHFILGTAPKYTELISVHHQLSPYFLCSLATFPLQWYTRIDNQFDSEYTILYIFALIAIVNQLLLCQYKCTVADVLFITMCMQNNNQRKREKQQELGMCAIMTDWRYIVNFTPYEIEQQYSHFARILSNSLSALFVQFFSWI